MQQRGALQWIELLQAVLEVGQIVNLGDVAVVCCCGDPGKTRGVGYGGLCACRIVHLVVQEDMDEVCWRLCADGCEGAELHQGCTITINHDDGAILCVQGNTERDAGCRAHATDHVEVLFPVGGRVKFTAGLASGGDDGGAFRTEF